MTTRRHPRPAGAAATARHDLLHPAVSIRRTGSRLLHSGHRRGHFAHAPGTRATPERNTLGRADEPRPRRPDAGRTGREARRRRRRARRSAPWPVSTTATCLAQHLRVLHVPSSRTWPHARRQPMAATPARPRHFGHAPAHPHGGIELSGDGSMARVTSERRHQAIPRCTGAAPPDPQRLCRGSSRWPTSCCTSLRGHRHVCARGQWRRRRCCRRPGHHVLLITLLGARHLALPGR